MNDQPDFDLIDTPVAASWAVSVTDDLKRSERRAWMVALIAAAVALLEAVALVFLVPIKEVQPYTLLVDRQTGNVEALAPLDTQMIQPDAALTRSFIVQYVIARESFTAASVQDDYRKVSLWSNSREAARYQAAMASTNPRSPLAYLPRGSAIRVEVKSVSSLAEDRSMVRYSTQVVDINGRAQAPQHWVSLLSHSFSDAAMSESDRYLNPLGFQVTSYRRDPETLPKEETTTRLDAPEPPKVER